MASSKEGKKGGRLRVPLGGLFSMQAPVSPIKPPKRGERRRRNLQQTIFDNKLAVKAEPLSPKTKEEETFCDPHVALATWADEKENNCSVGNLRKHNYRPTTPPTGPGEQDQAQMIRKLQRENRELKARLEHVRSDKQATRIDAVWKASEQAHKVARETLQGQCDYLQKLFRERLDQLDSGPWWERYHMLAEEHSVLAVKCDALSGALERSEAVRRDLHEQVMSARGNMRVFCRLRPQVDQDQKPHFECVDGQRGGRCQTLRVTADKQLSTDGCSFKQKTWDFHFDQVLQASPDQDLVYSHVQGLVQSALDGYNVCIFAYGQTGSGKTYTMEGMHFSSFPIIVIIISKILFFTGGDAGSESEGMIPRAVRLIFQMCEALKEKGWVYKIEASFLEIYNEQIRDLLGPSGQTHEIRVINNEVTVTNLKVSLVKSS